MANELQEKVIAKLDAMSGEFERIERDLADPSIATDPARLRELSVKRAAMSDLIATYGRFRATMKQIAENRALIADRSDADLAALAQEELPELESRSDDLLRTMVNDLVTADDRAVGSVVLEVRAGTGGAEAALWAGDLMEMYRRYATKRGWAMTMLELSPGEQGGLRNAIATVQGPGVWQSIGYEGGVHCVKRVPATETQGRVHTSTATVAVLPEPEKVQLDIPESDVKMDITTAQGPGGQNVNKVATAVHLIHVPTGIEVRMQESKSQQQNRTRAWQLLRARVYDHYQRQRDAQRAEARSRMIGSGDRSERIRTYRYKESLVVDHRLNEQFPLDKVLEGDLDNLVSRLIDRDRVARIAAL